MAYQREARAMMNIDWEQISQATQRKRIALEWRGDHAQRTAKARPRKRFQKIAMESIGEDERFIDEKRIGIA
jgi:hypothetical protein